MGFWSGDTSNKQISTLTKDQRGVFNNQMANLGLATNPAGLANYSNNLGASDYYQQLGGDQYFQNMKQNFARAGQDELRKIQASPMGRFSNAMSAAELDNARAVADKNNEIDMGMFNAQSDSRKNAIANQMSAITGTNNMQNQLATAQTIQNQQNYSPSTMDKISQAAGIMGSFLRFV